MRQQQGPYEVVRDKLRFSLLSPDAVRAALANFPPDTATTILCRCLEEEAHQRQQRERRTLLALMIGFLLWLAFNIGTGLLREVGGWAFLLGPTLLATAFWLSSRRFGVLRHNALMGLAGFVTEVRDKSALEPLCRATATLNGLKRPWEAELEAASATTLVRLLTRLSPTEAEVLPEEVKRYLRRVLTEDRQPSLMCAALLTLGSARDRFVLPQAERLATQHGNISVQEAARECLKDLS